MIALLPSSGTEMLIFGVLAHGLYTSMAIWLRKIIMLYGKMTRMYYFMTLKGRVTREVFCRRSFVTSGLLFHRLPCTFDKRDFLSKAKRDRLIFVDFATYRSPPEMYVILYQRMELIQVHKLFNLHVCCARQEIISGKITFCYCPDWESADD